MRQEMVCISGELNLSNREPRQCIDCETLIKKPKGTQIRCKDCQKKFRSKKVTWYNKICTTCGVSYRTKNGISKKCKECFPKYTCEVCGKEGIATGNHQKYCSKECGKLAKADFYYDGNYTKVLKRDGHQCKACGSTNRLTVHHIDYSGKGLKMGKANNEMDNLITFCDSCHQKLHVKTNQTLVNAHLEEAKDILADFIGGA